MFLKEYEKLDNFVQKIAKDKVFEYRKCGYNYLYLIKENYTIKITEQSKITLKYDDVLLFEKGMLLLDLKQKKEVIKLFVKMVYIFIEIQGYRSI